jgi:hypothetical protein
MQVQTEKGNQISLQANSNGDAFYKIPERYRKMENLHIVFWLFKDIAWCMLWRPLGIFMVFPTLLIAIIISWRTKNIVSELCHNLAIVLWISANSYWMISEFLHFDSIIISGAITYKHIAIIPFVLGILILAWFYLWYRNSNKKAKN